MPLLGLQTKSFEPLTRCPQEHRWLRLKTKCPLRSNRGIHIMTDNPVSKQFYGFDFKFLPVFLPSGSMVAPSRRCCTAPPQHRLSTPRQIAQLTPTITTMLSSARPRRSETGSPATPSGKLSIYPTEFLFQHGPSFLLQLKIPRHVLLIIHRLGSLPI